MSYYYGYAYEDNFVFRSDGYGVEKFDEKKKEWVKDPYICGVYSGDIPFKTLSEKEAMDKIERRNS